MFHCSDAQEEVFEDNWDDLSEEEQASATVLGWTTETWGQHTAKTQTAWDQLSEEDVEAAEALGYDQETWEDPEEFIDPVRTHSNPPSRPVHCRCKGFHPGSVGTRTASSDPR